MIATPHARVTVRGTRFTVEVNATATALRIDEGVVAFADRAGGEREVVAGGIARTGRAPAPAATDAPATVRPAPPPASGRTLVAPETVLAAIPVDAQGPRPDTAEDIDVFGRPWTRALRVTVPCLEASPYVDGEYALRLRVPLVSTPAAGDDCLVEAWIRAPQPAQVRFVVERAGAPWTKSLDVLVLARAEWTRVAMPLRFAADVAAAPLELQVWFGDRPAVVEVAAVRLVAGAPVPAADDAASVVWRAAAVRRVDALRRGDLAVRVVGADGEPRAGVAVRAIPQRGAFAVAVPVPRDAGAAYRAAAFTRADEAALESETKLPDWKRDPSAAPASVAIAAAAGLPVRGHAPAWPRLEGLGGDAPALMADPPALRARIVKHVREVVAALRGRVTSWDLVDDPYGCAEGMRALGDDVVGSWFAIASAADPAAALWLSCQGLLEHGCADRRRLDWYRGLVTRLRAQGAPVAGLSLKAHLPAPDGPALQAALDAVAALGLPVRISEFDVALDDDAGVVAAADALLAFAAHPAVTGVALWGMGWTRHGDRRLALLGEDGQSTAAGPAVFALLDAWRAPAASITDADGRCVLRAWRGRVRVEAGDVADTMELGEATAMTLRVGV